MADHTPGPWCVDDGDTEALGIFGPDAQAICYLSGDPESGVGLRGQAIDGANAHLIAAAPAMLAALQAWAEADSALGRACGSDQHQHFEHFEAKLAHAQNLRRAALAAAEGRDEGEGR